MTDNMNPTTDRAAIIDDIIEQWFEVLTSDDLEDLAAEALRKRYDTLCRCYRIDPCNSPNF